VRNYTENLKKSYSQLVKSERDRIEILIKTKVNQNRIAELLGRHPSTICREMKRNKSPVNKEKYLASQAEAQAFNRKIESHRKKRLKCKMIISYVKEKLKKGWSPEILAGRLQIDFPKYKTNYESIYQYIYKEKPELVIYLARCHKKRRKKRKNSIEKRIGIPNRVCITERPDEANLRTERGHWEADTVISRKSKDTLNVLYDRSLRLTRITKMKNNTALENVKAIRNRLCRTYRRTITYDNGKENVRHELINEYLATTSYFCHPYCSSDKGGVESVIGLIRRYLPKGTNFAKISKEEIKRIEWLLNDRPRKCLGFFKPNELHAHCA